MPREGRLVSELSENITGEVRFDQGSRALYSTDSSNYRQLPIGVVIPKNVPDVIQVFEICSKAGVPVLSRGGGTSLAGQCCNVAVVIDFSKYMNEVIEINPAEKWARVQPGLILDELQEHAKKHGLLFGPDPSTHNHCTLGGMIGNNSCGTHSVMAGETSANVIELDVLTYDGLRMTVGPTSDSEIDEIIRGGGRRAEIYSKLKNLRDRYADQIRTRFPQIPRRVSGYGLDQLLPENGFNVARALVGTEATCVTVLDAKVRLVDNPKERCVVVLGYPDVYHAADHVPEIMRFGPIALEGIDDNLVQDMTKKKIHPERAGILPPGSGWLIVEFGGETRQEVDEKAKRLMGALRRKSDAPSMKLLDDPEQEKILWKVRESGLGATARVPGSKDTWEGWEDSSVPPAHLGKYLRALRQLFNQYGYACALYGHFGQGCVHTRIDFDLESADGIKHFRSFLREASELVVSLGGSLSGEHGDGQSRAEFLPIMFGDELVKAFQEFKSIWDPTWKMNPGKIVHPYRVDENLRLGSHYNPAPLKTHFKFAEDDRSFSRATLRCVGVGECRKMTKEGVMCPSFKVTREEKDSTRGRAHLLFEMTQGNPLRKKWKEESVKDSLDLCLACKGCKSECPMGVDMATYKAEFLSHYYRGRMRPISAYTMGLIYWWSRIVSSSPTLSALVNLAMSLPIIGSLLKRLAGISSERQIPRFAGRTFKSWFFSRRSPLRRQGKRVVLWADTFNNHFFPETARSAVQILENAGFEVTVPKRSLCCGRPLYDHGMLDLAKVMLTQILHELKSDIQAGTPLVVLEPSCLAVFRDELLNLFPNHMDAKRLQAQAFSLSEFLVRHAPDYEFPQFPPGTKAVVQGHCHQKAIGGMAEEQAILKRMGLDVEILDLGCCGMAGSFGFERDHYDVSIKVGEFGLLPVIRKTSEDTLIIANGFSCHEQIFQSTGRQALHLAQVIELAQLGEQRKVA